MRRAALLILTHLVVTSFLFALATPLPPEVCGWCGEHRELLYCKVCRTQHCEGCYAWHATKPEPTFGGRLRSTILAFREAAELALY